MEQLRSILSAGIIKALDSRKLSDREAEKLTGTPYTYFSRIRNAKLDRFTADKLMKIVGKLDQEVLLKPRFRTVFRRASLQLIRNPITRDCR